LLRGETVKFSDLPGLCAEALHDDEDMQALAELAFEDEFGRMVDAGELIVLDPLTLAPQRFPLGNVLQNSVLKEEELRPLLEARGMVLIVESRTAADDHSSETPGNKPKESPQERGQRLAARRAQLKARQVKAWQKQIASEEKCSPSTVKQVLRRHDEASRTERTAHAPFGLNIKSS
jgi:hypothetical protein